MIKYLKLCSLMRLTLCAAGLLAFAACHRQDWHEAAGGLQYRVVTTHPGGVPVAGGATVKLRFTQKIGDSVYLSTSGNMPLYQLLIPSLVPPYSFLDALAYNIHEGDSLVCRQPLDTLVSKKLIRQGPWVKAHRELVTTLKVIRIFRSDSLVKADKAREKARLDRAETLLGPKRVQEYLSRNNISSARTIAGTWLSVLDPGAAKQPKKGDTVYLQFRLKTLQGRTLSSNLNRGFHQPRILKDALLSHVLPPAVDSSLCLLGKGARAVIYIPVMKGLGGMPSGPNSLRYDDLILEVRVTDIRKPPKTRL